MSYQTTPDVNLRSHGTLDGMNLPAMLVDAHGVDADTRESLESPMEIGLVRNERTQEVCLRVIVMDEVAGHLSEDGSLELLDMILEQGGFALLLNFVDDEEIKVFENDIDQNLRSYFTEARARIEQNQRS